MTPTKDTIDSGSSSAESEISQTKSRPRPESPHLRADAVSLEIPAKVHGTIVPNLAPGASLQAQPFEEQTSTMIVFPQGGVLKMSTSVSAGQVMVLTNLKSRQDAICRVVKVRAYGKTQSYVEVEFTSAQPGYWGVYFPSDGPEVARGAQPEPANAPTSPSVSPASASAPIPAVADQKHGLEVAPAASPVSISSNASGSSPVRASAPLETPTPVAPATPIKPKLPESTFAAIGTQEEVLPAAAATKAPRINSFENVGKVVASADTDISDAIDSLIAPSVNLARTAPNDETSGRAAASSAAVSSAPRTASAAVSVSAAVEQTLPAPKQMFGVALDSAQRTAEKSAQSTSNKAPMFIGIAAVLAVAVGGAYYYLHMRPAAVASAAQPNASPSTAQPNAAPQSPALNAGTASQGAGQVNAATEPPAASVDGPEARNEVPATALAGAGSREAVRQSEVLEPRRERPAPAVAAQPSAPARSQPAVAIPSTFGALNTRPVVNAQRASAGEAPALQPGGSPAPEGALSGISAPPPQLAAPQAPPKQVSNAPVRVGGRILPPKLVSSVVPVYPALARQTGVTGTVVVDTTIDKEGHVAKMKVVSGPLLLRNAALNALREWRYAPSRLNGEPISVQMVVSIQFNR